MVDEISCSEIMMKIEKLNVEIQKVDKIVRKKTEEIKEKKIKINRLDIQLRKQKLSNEMLVNEKNNIDKSQEKYKDELNDKLDQKKEMLSKITIQFEKIKRLLAKRDDRNEFTIDQQTKFTNAISDSTHKNTGLLSKTLESGKKYKYYKSMCKTLMIEDILSNNSNVENAKKLTEENIVLSEKYQSSKKALKKTLDNVEFWKYRYGSYFDESYVGKDQIDKREILKLIISTFNLLISKGYMCYWKSMAKLLTKNAKLWTTPTHDQSGMIFKVNFPFDENTNLKRNNNHKNDGFKSLEY
eukprot:XP_016657322.1 PREDICTED: uncharacterized protein LOC100572005 isoform X2 [Acyrthosiphon pisum]